MRTLTASARVLRRLKPRRLLTSLPHVVEHDGTRAERSLILLKPDAVERRLVGRLLGRFEDRGLAIVALRWTSSSLTPSGARTDATSATRSPIIC